MYMLEYITVCHTLVQVKIKEYYSITVKTVRLGWSDDTYHMYMIIAIYVMLWYEGLGITGKPGSCKPGSYMFFTHVHMVQACIRKR